MNHHFCPLPPSNLSPILFSIIIPIYNVEDYLAECLQSVLDQTSGCWEAILVNDGSTDSSPRIAQSFVEKDSRFRFVSRVNGGLSAARNTGLKVAAGDYVLFLDSDDKICLDTLQQFGDILTSDPGLDLIRANFLYFFKFKESLCSREDSDHGWVDGYSAVMSGISFLKLNDSYPFLPSAWRMLYRRLLLLENHLFFTEGILYEDLDITARIIVSAQKMVKLDYPFYSYRVRENSIMTGKASSKGLFSVQTIFKHNYAFLKKSPFSATIEPFFILLLCQALVLGFRIADELHVHSDFLTRATWLILKKYRSKGRDYRYLWIINFLGYPVFKRLIRIRSLLFNYLKF